MSLFSPYLPAHKSVFLPHMPPAHCILRDAECPKCPCYLADQIPNYLFINKLCVSNLLVIMKCYTIIGYTAWYGQTKPKTSTSECTGNLNVQKRWLFWQKYLFLSTEKALPWWTPFNGYFTSYRLTEDIRKFLTIYQNPSSKDAEIGILLYSGYAVLFHWGVAPQNRVSVQKSLRCQSAVSNWDLPWV